MYYFTKEIVMRMIIKTLHTKLKLSDKKLIDIYFIDYDIQKQSPKIKALINKINKDSIIITLNSDLIETIHNGDLFTEEIQDKLHDEPIKWEIVSFFDKHSDLRHIAY